MNLYRMLRDRADKGRPVRVGVIGKHVVMVNVEADALLGPMLQRKAERAGLVYSMAYGDQPALIAEKIDWAQAVGLEVVCAGKGTRYQPEYHYSTPQTVWGHYGFSGDLKPGDVLDGEGGTTVYGRLVSARESLKRGCLPMGLASQVKVLRPVPMDAVVTCADVAMDESLFSFKLRRAMEAEAQEG